MSFDNPWPVMTLKDAGVILIDCDHRTPMAQESGFPYVAIPQLKDGHVRLDGSERRISFEDFVDWTKKLKPQEHDVIVVRRCNSGDSAVVPKNIDWAIGQNLVVLRSTGELVYPPFLRWLVRGEEWWEQVGKYINVGAVFDSLKCREIPLFELTIPPIANQIEIAQLLAALDDRITLLRETNTTLEAIAQALFKSWFVDFDPVRAKQAGLAPTGMSDATAALFPSRFTESPLGLVPEGWRVDSVESFAERVGMGPFGSNIKVETFVESGVPVISGQHLKQTLVEDNTFNYVTEEHAQKLAKSCVKPGDVIFTHAGSIGQVSLLHRDALFDQYVLSQRQFFLRCNNTLMRPEWITYYFRSPLGQHKLLANTSQVGVPSIARPVSYLRSIRMVIPPILVVDAFSSIADAVHQSVMSNRKQIITLTTLRDTLLPRLISGQLRLPEAEAALGEVG